VSDALFTSQSAAGGDSKIDNELVTTTAGVGLLRQRVRIGGSTGTLLADVSSQGSLNVNTPVELLNSTNITTASANALAPATGLALASPTANSFALFNTLDDHESSHVTIQGTWSGTLTPEVSLDGTTWFPTNLRRNASGNQISNSITQNGLWNGTFAGYNYLRIRALPGFTGTATIVASASKLGGTYLLSAVTTLTQQEYNGSAAAGNVNWQVNSQEIALPNGSGEGPVFMLTNQDATGGRTMVLYNLTLSATQSCRFRRYRSTTLTRTGGGTRVTPVNQGTAVISTGTETAGLFYAGTNITFTGVTLGTTNYISSRFIGSTGGNASIDYQGGVRVPPGQSLLVTAVQPANSTIVTVEFVYSDGSTLT
jgi:hypothetical protein